MCKAQGGEGLLPRPLQDTDVPTPDLVLGHTWFLSTGHPVGDICVPGQHPFTETLLSPEGCRATAATSGPHPGQDPAGPRSQANLMGPGAWAPGLVWTGEERVAEGPCHQAQCLGHWSWPRVRVLFTTSPQEQAQAGGASQHSSHTQEMWPRP